MALPPSCCAGPTGPSGPSGPPGPTGPGSNTASNVLTWRPGSGLPGPIVFDSWIALYAELESLRTAAHDSGAFTIIFDDSDGALDMPVGDFDMDRSSLISVHGFDSSSTLSLVMLADGVVITNLLSITGLLIRPVATSTTSAITLADGQTLNLYAAQLSPAATSAHTLLFVTGHAYLRLSDECIIAPTDGGQVIQLDSGATLDVHLDGSRSQLISGTVVGDGTTTLNVFIGAESSVFGWPQIFVTGAVLYLQQGAFWGANNGNPNGILTAAMGAVFVDFDTGLQYQNIDGGTTWLTNSPQRFTYTATGAEGASFDITLPAARLSTDYVAQVTGGGLAFQLTFDVPLTGYTLTKIHVNSSAALTVGDVLIVDVADLT